LFLLLLNSCKMTSPQGMDELFWGRDHEDVNDWAEQLTMAAEVRDLTTDKLFKTAKLNLRVERRSGLGGCSRCQPTRLNYGR